MEGMITRLNNPSILKVAANYFVVTLSVLGILAVVFFWTVVIPIVAILLGLLMIGLRNKIKDFLVDSFIVRVRSELALYNRTFSSTKVRLEKEIVYDKKGQETDFKLYIFILEENYDDLSMVEELEDVVKENYSQNLQGEISQSKVTVRKRLPSKTLKESLVISSKKMAPSFGKLKSTLESRLPPTQYNDEHTPRHILNSKA